MNKLTGLMVGFAAIVIALGTVVAQGPPDKGAPPADKKGAGKGGKGGGGRGQALLIQDDAKKTFEKLDSNKDGKLSRVEYLKIVESITLPEPAPEKKAMTKETLTTNAETLYDTLDPEKKDSVTYEQYSTYVEEAKTKGAGAGKGAGKGAGAGKGGGKGKKAPE